LLVMTLLNTGGGGVGGIGSRFQACPGPYSVSVLCCQVERPFVVYWGRISAPASRI
jgi:hypothetical protein